MNSRELIRMLEDNGWKEVRVVGSHHHFKHPVKSLLITVPHPKKDLPQRTVKSILKKPGSNESGFFQVSRWDFPIISNFCRCPGI